MYTVLILLNLNGWATFGEVGGSHKASVYGGLVDGFHVTPGGGFATSRALPVTRSLDKPSAPSRRYCESSLQ